MIPYTLHSIMSMRQSYLEDVAAAQQKAAEMYREFNSEGDRLRAEIEASKLRHAQLDKKLEKEQFYSQFFETYEGYLESKEQKTSQGKNWKPLGSCHIRYQLNGAMLTAAGNPLTEYRLLKETLRASDPSAVEEIERSERRTRRSLDEMTTTDHSNDKGESSSSSCVTSSSSRTSAEH